jgi:hypothetical protein
VKTFPPLVPLPASPLVTVTVRPPVVAPAAMVMFAVMLVELLNVVEFTVIPDPEKFAASEAPFEKPVPVIVMF